MAASMKFYLLCSLSIILVGLIHEIYSHGHGHGHDHGHSHDEPASFKYSKQANEAAAKTEQEHSAEGPEKVVKTHSHSHSHTPGHGHSHDGHHGHSHDQPKKAHGHDDGTSRSFPDKVAESARRNFDPVLWAKALGATALISVTPVFILFLIPVQDANEKHQPLLKILLAFASGGLLGDAFLHLIPHAVSPHSHTGEMEGHGHTHQPHVADEGHHHGHSHAGNAHDMTVGLWVLCGIVAFLCVEKFVRLVKGDHGHSHGPVKPAVIETKTTQVKKTTKDAKDSDKEEDESSESEASSSKKKEKTTTVTAAAHSDEQSKGGSLRIAGYLNLAADFAHNFTDGLAIGASFLAGETVGIITTVTILLHEVPHEIGDFAILVQSGCSKKKAMMLQFTTAIGAMCGTLMSLTAGGIGTEATLWVLPFTAGGFIYIATVSVIPELLEDTKLGQSIKEIIALLVGVYMMVLIAQYE